MIIFILAGCSPGSGLDPRGDEATLEPTPYAPGLAAQAEEQVLGAAEVQQELTGILALLTDLDPELMHEGHAIAMSHGEPSCPAVSDHNGQDLWNEDCETSDGVAYRGLSLTLDMVNFFDDDQRPVDRFRWFHGQMTTETPDGHRYLAIGDSALWEYVSEDGSPLLGVELKGDYHWDSPEADGTWMSHFMHSWMDMAVGKQDGAAWWQLNGSLSRLDGRLRVASFVDFEMDAAACELEPSGRIEVKDQGGHWYEIEFDQDCDGCGQLYGSGESLGEVCVDVSPFMQWEHWPWG